MGNPDQYFADLRVACYKLNQTSSRTLCLFFGILPVAATKNADQLEVALIQFDDQDRVRRVEIKTLQNYPWALRNAAKFWVTVAADKPPGH